jgi:hypothetical protein
MKNIAPPKLRNGVVFWCHDIGRIAGARRVSRKSVFQVSCETP